MQSAKEICRGKWHSILPQCGVSPKFLTGKQTPCPSCEGKTRFRFDDQEGRGTWFCNKCGAGDGFMLISLVKGIPNREAVKAAVQLAGEAEFRKPRQLMDQEEAHRKMREVWSMSRPITPEDDAGRYLRHRRTPIPTCDSLRYVPMLSVSGEAVRGFPAMVARVRDSRGASCNIHRTYLLDGKKAPIQSPRKLMATGNAPKAEGCRIELFDAAEEMGIAEGIETALRAADIFGLPVWSAISSGHLEQFQPPAIVRRLHIFGDADLKFGGQKSAYALAHRLACAKNPIGIEVHIPDTLGTDWGDQ
jgi:putative DNA primase/helicase